MAFKTNDILNIVSFTGEVKSSLIKTLVLICQQKKPL
jgi:hypothetical protein